MMSGFLGLLGIGSGIFILVRVLNGRRSRWPLTMDNANVIELLNRVREIVVRSIEAEEHEQHEVAMRLLVEAREKIDQEKQLLASSSAAAGS